MQALLKKNAVSVPIRGLFFLTHESVVCQYQSQVDTVSVPIRGLFFLTGTIETWLWEQTQGGFRPHQGIIFFNVQRMGCIV